MTALEIIAKKRDGGELTADDIQFFVEHFTNGDIPDYQAAAWCMAVFLRGMTDEETSHLTMSMANSGERLDLHSIFPVVGDKHSTGGVGDKTTLVVLPLVAAEGVPMGKMSGRGLGFTGGTIDKLESIPGFNVTLSKAEFLSQLAAHGLVLSGQSAQLAPADGKFYALRDVTATVASIPLIASSVMSKKIAAGTDIIVLDVKVGSGAFMKELIPAKELARVMVSIGRKAGRRVSAVLTDMNQPLGFAVGNALEVKEAIATLQGKGPHDFRHHCLALAGQLLLMAGKAASSEEAQQSCANSLDNGKAYDKFAEWISSQHGDLSYIEHPERLPQAPLQKTITALHEGYINAVDALTIGNISVELGAGRQKKGDPIDLAVGLEIFIKVGDYIEIGRPLYCIHANSQSQVDNTAAKVDRAIMWSNTPVAKANHILDIISS
jgi:pyrimidine-nucleoside phosphorylase